MERAWSVTKEGLELLEDEVKKIENSKAKFENLWELLKETLDKKVGKVIICTRVVSSPAAL